LEFYNESRRIAEQNELARQAVLQQRIMMNTPATSTNPQIQFRLDKVGIRVLTFLIMFTISGTLSHLLARQFGS
jgi:hypothetical protein